MPENKQYHYDDKNEPLTTMHAVSKGIAMPVRHLHSQYEFYYVRSGRVAIENNADSLVVEAPCFVIHKPFSLHRVNADFGNKYDRYVINCSKENLDKIIPLVPKFSIIDSHSLTVININREIDIMLVELMTKIHTYALSSMTDMATAYLALLLITLTEYADLDHLLPTHREGYIGEVVNYIGQHYAENITIEQLAELFFVSRSKLIADFKKYIKVSIKQYTMLMRIYNAQRFLQSGKTIAETAYLCGFYDESHFVGTFHSITGVTPKSFLKSIKQT